MPKYYLLVPAITATENLAKIEKENKYLRNFSGRGMDVRDQDCFVTSHLKKKVL